MKFIIEYTPGKGHFNAMWRCAWNVLRRNPHWIYTAEYIQAGVPLSNITTTKKELKKIMAKKQQQPLKNIIRKACGAKSEESFRWSSTKFVSRYCIFFIRIQIANANATNVLNILESISSLLLLLFIQKTETHFSNSKQKPKIKKKKPKIPPNFSDVADFSYVLYDWWQLEFFKILIFVLWFSYD